MEPGADTFEQLDTLAPSSYGSRLKADARRYYGTFLRLAQRGEALPAATNRVDIDPVLRDRWGIPVLRFAYRWGAQELNQTRHAQASMAELVEAAGGRLVRPPAADPGEAILRPGAVIHEVGGAPTGSDPQRSVTDPHGRVWGVPNLYVIDGAVFPASAHKNPTLTILAFAWRASEHAATELGNGSA
jgi:choline dehydrogenase-like flavoprotein